MSIIAEALKKAQEKRCGEKDLPGAGKHKIPAVTRAVPGLFQGAEEKPVAFRPDPPLSSGSHGRKTRAAAIAAGLLALTAVLLVTTIAGLRTDNRLFSPTSTTRSRQGSGDTRFASTDNITLPGTAPAHQERPNPLPALSGIMFDNRHPRAVLNGHILSEGDTLDNIVLLKIFPDRVRLSLEGEEREVRLP